MKEKKKNSLWQVISPVQSMVYGAIGVSALGAVLSLFGIALVAWILNEVKNTNNHVLLPFLGVVALFVASYILRILAMKISHSAAFKLESLIRIALAQKLAKVPMGYIASTNTGSLTKVFMEDVNNLHGFVADSTPIIGKSVMSQIVTLIILFAIDWRFALASLLVLIVALLVVQLSLRNNQTVQKNYDQARSDITASIVEFVQAMPVVRTFDNGSESFKRYSNALERFHTIVYQWMKSTGTSGKLGIVLLGPMPTLIVLMGLGGYWMTHDSANFGVWLASLMLAAGLTETMLPLMWLGHFIRKADLSATRINEVLHEPILSEPAESQLPADNSITFEHVHFAYNESHQTLEDITFTVKPNTITALVGPSGAGKSTVAKLMMRFWDITRGDIRIGGVAITDMTLETLSDHVSFVAQDNFLFNDTILANLRLANRSLTDDQIMAMAKEVHIHDMIEALPLGYMTVVGERGSRLSGGQRQCLTILRAFLQDTKIVILDEPTSYADPHTECMIVRAISVLSKNRTLVLVAHKLNLIVNVDQIVVLDQGHIVGKGKHADLLAKCPTYKTLWNCCEETQSWVV